MKKISIIFISGLLGLGAIGTGCKQPAAVSSKTGMKYNDKSNGGFQVNTSKIKQGPGPGLIAIEGGTFVLGGSLQQDLTYEYDSPRRRVSVPTFYMDETEVANVDWLEYLHWISTNFPNDRELYYNALPDSLVWRRPLSYNEPYVNNYLRHPAFQDYPVVGVTWEQANDYCVWRTDRVNELKLRNSGRLAAFGGDKTKSKGKSSKTGGAATTTTASVAGKPAEPFNTDIYLNGQYRGEGIDGKNMKPDFSGGDATSATPATGKSAKNQPKAVRPDRLEDGEVLPDYRLPTEAEWEYAALALAGNTQFENITDGRIYPWSGLGVRSSRKNTQGLIMANFKRGEGDNMGTGGSLNDKADITAPVRSFSPNDFGLYNMAGNVNEWVGDVYRKLSFEDIEDFSPFRGNVYVDKKIADKEKGLYAKDKYGRPIKEPAKSARKQKWSELNASANPATPPANGAVADSSKTTLAGIPSQQAYNPDFRDAADSADTKLYGIATLVNNKSRVYKGGSWNDRAYWLNPATRRFMQEDESSAEVGFRCAMNSIGGPEVNPRGKAHFLQPKSKAAKAPRVSKGK